MTSTPAPAIVVVGSLNMDIVVRVATAPAAGETIAGESISGVPGGKGGNQAVSCARQGATVAMVGRVGDDPNGRALRDALVHDGIGTAGVAVDPAAATGAAVIVVEDSGQNRIIYLAGSNAALEIDEAALAETLAGVDWVVTQLETPMPTVVAALRAARRAGCRTMLNPSPIVELPAEIWPLLDALVVNEIEARMLSGLPVENVAEAARAARALRALGPAEVVITLGGAGAVAADPEGCRHFPAPVVEAIDTTAAGDTFLGAFVAARARGDDFETAATDGIRAAALCITRPGAQPSIPTRAEVLASPPAPRPVAIDDAAGAS